MTTALRAVLLVCAVVIVARGQPPPDARLQAELRQLFPSATAFSPKGGNPPHFDALIGGSGSQRTAGYAFWTTELEPLERGYDGPIKILVGMDMRGVLTGIVVVEHDEPYGDFSIDTPAFAAQFRGKNIRDRFEVGRDLDAISRASISVTSASRAVRNSARRVAKALLMPPEAGR